MDVAKSPDAHLLVCAPTPDGLPDEPTRLTAPFKDGLDRVFPAYGAIRAQLNALINWHTPGACPE